MKKFFKEIFTDSLGRPEIKNIIGIPMVFIGGVVACFSFFGLIKLDWTGWGIFMGFFGGLITVSAVADGFNDSKTTGGQ